VASIPDLSGPRGAEPSAARLLRGRVQRQRVAVARALALPSHPMVFDERVSAHHGAMIKTAVGVACAWSAAGRYVMLAQVLSRQSLSAACGTELLNQALNDSWILIIAAKLCRRLRAESLPPGPHLLNELALAMLHLADCGEDGARDRMLEWVTVARSWHLLIRFGIVTIAVIGATALQLPVTSDIPGKPFLLYFVLVLISASTMGRTAGFLAVGETAVASVLHLEPVYSLKLTRAIDLLGVEIYLAMAALSVEAFHRLVNDALAQRSAANSLRLLLREMKHRVTNDFSAVAAMLSSCTPKLADPQSKETIQHVLRQVHVYAIVHRELGFSEERWSFVNDKVFIEGLGKVLKDAIPGKIEALFEHTGIEFSLSQSQAVTLGLIINELVTNSIKYAFLDRPDGRIGVDIYENSGDCCVRVSDNGGGCNGKPKGTGKGTELVNELTQKLDGVFDLHSSPSGTVALIRFPISSARPSLH